MSSISLEDLDRAINQELTLYSQNVIDGIKKETTKSMSALVKETKATAPIGKRKKHYKNSIKQKKVSETPTNLTKMWYVDGKDYRLSHLLENGHALRNGGRTTGTHFIKKAEEKIVEEYIANCEEVIKNG